jgi:hypothetical protein
MHSLTGSFIAALWEKDVLISPNLKENHIIPGSPFVDPKRRIEWTRNHIWIYNAILGAVLLLIWLSRCIKSFRRRRGAPDEYHDKLKVVDGTASDSCSTLTGTATPTDTKKNDGGGDNEQTLLLPESGSSRHFSIWRRITSNTRAFLMYQPRPLPVVNKVLPDNRTTLFILAFIVLNAVLTVINVPFEPRMIMVFGDRCANLFAANLPLLYLLAAKNQPLKFLTGHSYEALNILHRRVGELMCFFAVLHMAASFYIYFDLLKPLLGISLWRFVCNRLILCGLIAFICYETLYITSLGNFRQRWYELFLASHIVLQAAGLGFLWFHYFSSRVYIIISILVFLIDRLIYRLMLKSTSVKANLEVLEDGATVMLSADWAIPGRRPLFVGRKCIQNGWDPADHVFITIPALSKSAILQSHPFTIASASPDMTTSSPYAWFSLLIRAHDGFSRDLLKYAQTRLKVDVRIDGPYGSLEPLHMLENSDHAILVAGGSGIAVVFPLIWALLKPATRASSTESDLETYQHQHRRRKVTLIWVIHSESHASWLPQDRIDELQQWGLDVRIPSPTTAHGRPDVGQMIEDLVYTHRNQKRRRSVVVSGPDALNRDVRNTCSRLVRHGMNVAVTVEKFGW